MAQTLLILNEASYGSERTYNALRLAVTLAAQPEQTVRLFLLADAVLAAKAGQKVPPGYYSIENMLAKIAGSADIALCGTCMDARGLRDDELIEGARRATMVVLARWTIEADKVLVF